MPRRFISIRMRSAAVVTIVVDHSMIPRDERPDRDIAFAPDLEIFGTPMSLLES